MKCHSYSNDKVGQKKIGTSFNSIYKLTICLVTYGESVSIFGEFSTGECTGRVSLYDFETGVSNEDVCDVFELIADDVLADVMVDVIDADLDVPLLTAAALVLELRFSVSVGFIIVWKPSEFFTVDSGLTLWPMAAPGFDRTLCLNLLAPAVEFFNGDARSCFIFSSSFFIAFTYDAFELSCLSMSNMSKVLAPFDSGGPYFAYKSAIPPSFLFVVVIFANVKSSTLKSSNKSSSSAFALTTRLFAVLNPCSSSSITMQSDSLLAVLIFCKLFAPILSVIDFTFLVESVDVGAATFVCENFVLNVNLPVLFAAVLVFRFILLLSFSLRDIKLNTDGCFDIVVPFSDGGVAMSAADNFYPLADAKQLSHLFSSKDNC